MSNKLLDAMVVENNYGRTENGSLMYKSTLNKVYDMFGLGGAYRSRSDQDCILLFKEAYEEDAELALKCLFYLRDREKGQGERKYFRVVFNWLAIEHPQVALRNMTYVPFFGRWDDLYCLVGTPIEKDAFDFMYHQFALDLKSETPSLLAKWLKSENTSSAESRHLATITRTHWGLTSKQYRKLLSASRERIRVLEKLMSEQRWDEIHFDKIPSKAGMKYRNAFARNDFLKERYEAFAKNKETKVNAGVLYPADVVNAARNTRVSDATQVAMIEKYWDNLADFFNNAIFNGVAVVDTSGSMTWNWGYNASGIMPIDVAVALGMYCAEKCNPASPWYGNYITFSRKARLVPVRGVNFVDKVHRIIDTNLCENTNIESVFDLILDCAIKNNLSQEDMPENIVIISDMEFDAAMHYTNCNTVMETCMKKYQAAGYKLPHLIFWNVNARNDNFAMKDEDGITFVSGYSPSLFESILTGKTGQALMLDKLLSERYKDIH